MHGLVVATSPKTAIRDKDPEPRPALIPVKAIVPAVGLEIVDNGVLVDPITEFTSARGNLNFRVVEDMNLTLVYGVSVAPTLRIEAVLDQENPAGNTKNK
jgi:hypothetical protein